MKMVAIIGCRKHRTYSTCLMERVYLFEMPTHGRSKQTDAVGERDEANENRSLVWIRATKLEWVGRTRLLEADGDVDTLW